MTNGWTTHEWPPPEPGDVVDPEPAPGTPTRTLPPADTPAAVAPTPVPRHLGFPVEAPVVHGARYLATPTPAEATWAPAAHWLPLLTHWIGPLVLLLSVGRRSERVRAEAVASLNWEITVALLLAATTLLPGPYPVQLVLAAAVIVLSVLLHLAGALEARRGYHYDYLFALPIVR